jgi:PilZ domain-containing protein
MDQNRRRFLRKVSDDFICIQIERDEVGKVLNVSEGGLSFNSFTPVPRNLPVYFWFSFNLKDRIEAMGEVTWTDLSRTKGGLRFTQLSPGGREQVRKWLSRMRPEGVPVASEEPVSQLVLAGKHASSGKNELDRVARFAAKARAHRPTSYRSGEAPGIRKSEPAPTPGMESPKARADHSFYLNVTEPAVSRVVPPPATKPVIKKIDAPKAPSKRSILSLEGLNPADLPKVAQPPAIKIDLPKAPVDRLTLSLEELDPGHFNLTPNPVSGIDVPKIATDHPASSVEAAEPADLKVASLPGLEFESPKDFVAPSILSLGIANPSDLEVALPRAPEIETPKASTEGSVFLLEGANPQIVLPPAPAIEPPKVSAASSVFSVEGANPAGLKVVPPPAPDAEPPKAPAIRPAFGLEETNLADSKVALPLPPALGIEPPKAVAERPILSLEGAMTKGSKGSSRSLRGIESFVTGLVPLQRHVLAKKRQLLRGMVLGMCISAAVTAPTVNYWNRTHAENIKPAPTTSLGVKNNSDVPTTPPAQPAVTKPSVPVGNIFSGSPAPNKWTTPDLSARRQLAAPYRQEAMKEVVARIPKPPAGAPAQSQPSGPSAGGKKLSMNPTQLWGAVQAGNSTAALQLAEMYIKGDGVPQNCQQARVLLLVASEKRNTAAIKRLHDLDKGAACP